MRRVARRDRIISGGQKEDLGDDHRLRGPWRMKRNCRHNGAMKAKYRMEKHCSGEKNTSLPIGQLCRLQHPGQFARGLPPNPVMPKFALGRSFPLILPFHCSTSNSPLRGFWRQSCNNGHTKGCAAVSAAVYVSFVQSRCCQSTCRLTNDCSRRSAVGARNAHDSVRLASCYCGWSVHAIQVR